MMYVILICCNESLHVLNWSRWYPFDDDILGFSKEPMIRLIRRCALSIYQYTYIYIYMYIRDTYLSRVHRDNFFEHETTVRNTRVRIKCSNAFYGAKSIVRNNDRVAYLLVHQSVHRHHRIVWRVRLHGDRIYLSVSVQTWNYTRSLAVRRKWAWRSHSFSLCRDKLRLLLSKRDVPFVRMCRTSVKTRTLAGWKIYDKSYKKFYGDITEPRVDESRFCDYRSTFFWTNFS